MSFTFSPIGLIQSCFKEKFGIPRQAGLVSEARATLVLSSPYDDPEAVRELAGFSHLWLIFVFHATMAEGWKPTVRPPRLGGNRRVGVFASRSMFRPNPIGLSAVELESISQSEGKTHLHLKGVDLLDGTPVLDIKPYLPYADAIPSARGGFAPAAPAPSLEVEFSPEASAQCTALEQTHYPHLRRLIVQLLQLDPRPAYYAQRPPKQTFGMKLFTLDIQWEMRRETAVVISLD